MWLAVTCKRFQGVSHYSLLWQVEVLDITSIRLWRPLLITSAACSVLSAPLFSDHRWTVDVFPSCDRCMLNWDNPARKILWIRWDDSAEQMLRVKPTTRTLLSHGSTYTWRPTLVEPWLCVEKPATCITRSKKFITGLLQLHYHISTFINVVRTFSFCSNGLLSKILKLEVVWQKMWVVSDSGAGDTCASSLKAFDRVGVSIETYRGVAPPAKGSWCW